MDTPTAPWRKPPIVRLTDVFLVAFFHCVLTGISLAISIGAYMRDDGLMSAGDHLGMIASKVMMMPLALPALMAGHWHVGLLMLPLNSFVCAYGLLYLVAARSRKHIPRAG
jgi:hypothetical protein